MEDIPVDISNKKFITTHEAVDIAGTPNVEIPRVKEEPKPVTRISSKSNVGHKVKGNRVRVAKIWLMLRIENFKKIQYPYLYGKFYDIYHFELVGYKPLDIALKLLVVVTILIVIGIMLVAFKEMVNLAF